VQFPVRIAISLLAGAGALASCGGSSGSRAVAPTTTNPSERVASTKTAAMDEFCGRLSGLTTAAAEVGVVTGLSQVRHRLATATAMADRATTGGTPPRSDTYFTILALDSDLRVVNGWVQTEATQSDLDHNRQPSNVRAHFIDLGVEFRKLEAWSATNCQAFSSGDD
jgi:hypothetical protein